jgi:hypothetical protein
MEISSLFTMNFRLSVREVHVLDKQAQSRDFAIFIGIYHHLWRLTRGASTCAGFIYSGRFASQVLFVPIFSCIFISDFSEIEANKFKTFPIILYGGFICLSPDISYDSIKVVYLFQNTTKCLIFCISLKK